MSQFARIKIHSPIHGSGGLLMDDIHTIEIKINAKNRSNTLAKNQPLMRLPTKKYDG